MTVRIEIDQTRTVEDGPIYRVTTSVIYAAGVAREIFVFNTETQDFSHVATTYDMENYPDNRTEALTNSAGYYRQAVVDIGYDTVTVATAAAAYTVARVDYLTSTYSTFTDSFEGSDTRIFES